MVFEGVCTWLMLMSGGVPMAALLGLLTGLLAFIPNIGAIVSGVLMVAVGFSAGTDEGLWAIVVYFVVQTVDGYLIVPYVARRTVDLAPGAGARRAVAVRRAVRDDRAAAGRPDRRDDQGQRWKNGRAHAPAKPQRPSAPQEALAATSADGARCLLALLGCARGQRGVAARPAATWTSK